MAGGKPYDLSVCFVPLPRFTLSPFALMIDALRLAADEGDRSRPGALPLERHGAHAQAARRELRNACHAVRDVFATWPVRLRRGVRRPAAWTRSSRCGHGDVLESGGCRGRDTGRGVHRSVRSAQGGAHGAAARLRQLVSLLGPAGRVSGMHPGGGPALRRRRRSNYMRRWRGCSRSGRLDDRPALRGGRGAEEPSYHAVRLRPAA